MVYYPKPKRTFNRDYEKAPGGTRLNELRLQRGLSMGQVCKKGQIYPSEMTDWCSNGKPIAKTTRIMAGLSRALEVHPDLLWAYLLGEVPLESIPPTKAQMRAAIPDSWVKALYPIVNIVDKKSVTEVLTRLSLKVLAKK